MTIIAIDPGPEQSAYVIWDGSSILKRQKIENALLVDGLLVKLLDADDLVIEKIASYGMAVGETVFETVFWSGRFAQAFYGHMKPVHRITRIAIKNHLCHSSKAKDANIRQALIDRIGSVGTKKFPGPLHGIAGDEWAALAVAVTWWDLHVGSKAA